VSHCCSKFDQFRLLRRDCDFADITVQFPDSSSLEIRSGVNFISRPDAASLRAKLQRETGDPEIRPRRRRPVPPLYFDYIIIINPIRRRSRVLTVGAWPEQQVLQVFGHDYKCNSQVHASVHLKIQPDRAVGSLGIFRPL
jgi:hypothetical protein